MLPHPLPLPCYSEDALRNRCSAVASFRPEGREPKGRQHRRPTVPAEVRGVRVRDTSLANAARAAIECGPWAALPWAAAAEDAASLCRRARGRRPAGCRKRAGAPVGEVDQPPSALEHCLCSPPHWKVLRSFDVCYRFHESRHFHRAVPAPLHARAGFREAEGVAEEELIAAPRVERLQVVGEPVGPLADGECYDDAVLRGPLASVSFGDRGAHCVANGPVVTCGGWRRLQI